MIMMMVFTVLLFSNYVVVVALVLSPQVAIVSSPRWCLSRRQQLVPAQQAAIDEHSAGSIHHRRWGFSKLTRYCRVGAYSTSTNHVVNTLVPTPQAAIGEYSASSIADHVAALVSSPQAAIGAYSASSNW